MKNSEGRELRGEGAGERVNFVQIGIESSDFCPNPVYGHRSGVGGSRYNHRDLLSKAPFNC